MAQKNPQSTIVFAVPPSHAARVRWRHCNWPMIKNYLLDVCGFHKWSRGGKACKRVWKEVRVWMFVYKAKRKKNIQERRERWNFILVGVCLAHLLCKHQCVCIHLQSNVWAISNESVRICVCVYTFLLSFELYQTYAWKTTDLTGLLCTHAYVHTYIHIQHVASLAMLLIFIPLSHSRYW